MCPSIALSDDTLRKLHAVAKPFVETDPEEVINRLVEEELARASNGSTGPVTAPAAAPNEMVLDPERPPSLTHSKLLQARVAGERLTRPKWNSLLRDIHVLAYERLGSYEALAKLTSANIQPGEHTDAGFHPIPEVGFSIQGIEANLAWEHTIRLARELGIPIEVTLEWRRKEGAAHPGRRAKMSWVPES